MKILFQGDSITDAGRNYDDPHDLGGGYPKYAAAALIAAHPEVDFEFIDLGISGNQTKHLVERLESDFIDIQPDIVSIMIGINDTWHHAETGDWIPEDIFEERYRAVLAAVRERTSAKIVIMEPYLLPVPDLAGMRADLDRKIVIVRKLARKFADVFVPTDGLLASALVGREVSDFSGDGVHPNAGGAAYIGKIYAEYVSPLIDVILKG